MKASLYDDIKTLMEKLELIEPIIRNELLQNILSALRGPDSSNGDSYIDVQLKKYTTARIRAIVCPSYVGDVNFIPLNSYEQNDKDNLLYKTADTHFVLHYEAAVGAIRKVYNYDLSKERIIEEIGHEPKTTT